MVFFVFGSSFLLLIVLSLQLLLLDQSLEFHFPGQSTHSVFLNILETVFYFLRGIHDYCALNIVDFVFQSNFFLNHDRAGWLAIMFFLGYELILTFHFEQGNRTCPSAYYVFLGFLGVGKCANGLGLRRTGVRNCKTIDIVQI